jgi:hypothetical protein
MTLRLGVETAEMVYDNTANLINVLNLLVHNTLVPGEGRDMRGAGLCLHPCEAANIQKTL